MQGTLWILYFAALAVAAPLDHEMDLNHLLAKFGDLLFETPDTESGERVARWNSTSSLNPEELGRYAEGDILFPRKSEPLSRNGLTLKSARWPKGIVPYVIAGRFSLEDRGLIERAVQEYARQTCVRFVERTGQSDYLYFTSESTGCWSSVGRVGGAQQLNLQSPGCLTKLGTVMHEMMHAIGFLHEQNRWERDDYVSVRFQNISPGRENNFDKSSKGETDGQGIDYDYTSVMHYSGYAFSKNGQPTIVPKVSGQELGQRENLSKRDIKKIRRMYKCCKGKSYLQ